MLGVGSLAHALLAPGHHHPGGAGGELLGAERHGPQAGATELVQAPGRRLHRDAGVDRRLAGRPLTGARLKHLAEDDLADVGGGHARPLQGAGDGRAAQLMGGKARKGAVEGPDGGSGGGDDDDVCHGGRLL